METWEVVIFCLLVLFIGVAILMLTIGAEKLRRKKHPVWYELYDRALANSIWVGSTFRKKLETINARRERFQELFFHGELTEEEYDNAMEILDKERTVAAKQFCIDKTAYGIEDDLKKADAYAKKHNLKWGILYD